MADDWRFKMFNEEKLSAVLTAYKEYFSENWKDEKYKWEAIAYFQKYWDVKAKNFLDMFMKATDKTYNLLASMNNYPRGMIKAFATVDPEAVRVMFIRLLMSQRILQNVLNSLLYQQKNYVLHMTMVLGNSIIRHPMLSLLICGYDIRINIISTNTQRRVR